MTPVLLLGRENDSTVADTLLGAIRSVQKSALHITGQVVALIPPGTENPDFIIIDNPGIPCLQLSRGIAIFKPGFTGEKSSCGIPEEFYAIAEPENSGAMQLLEKKGMRTVTCGLSQKDTVTFSSIGTGEAVVSLQRRLAAVSGHVLEPLEFPVKFNPRHTQYAVLAAAAVLCLCECVNEKTKLQFP